MKRIIGRGLPVAFSWFRRIISKKPFVILAMKQIIGGGRYIRVIIIYVLIKVYSDFSDDVHTFDHNWPYASLVALGQLFISTHKNPTEHWPLML